MIALSPTGKRRLTILLAVLLIAGALGAWFAWYKLFREVPQADWVAENGHTSEDMRFMYGSVGAERDAGIPYWIVYVLPRVFPEKLPGPGGYASFGMAWEQGKELPAGFSIKKIGFDRVANNCASCHTATYRTSPSAERVFVPSGPNHTFDLEAFFRFLVDCARDPRFNSDTLLAEIELSRPPDFSWIDRQIYRYLLIPITRKRLLERGPRFAWIYRHGPDWPDWGRGRDDAMNLTKYFLTTSKTDDSLGPTDMPSIWNLKKYKTRQGTRMNTAGDSWDANSVIIDSALGLLSTGPPNNQEFLDEVHWLNGYLDAYTAPKFPFPVEATKAAAGRAVFDAHCATCHWSARTGTVLPVEEVGTDIQRILTWNKEAAKRANDAVKAFGIDRKGLVEADLYGYVASFLDGIWLRAPYLHNGSVPSLRDLLKPAAQRPQTFYRGYDVYDPVNVGFITQGPEAAHAGTLYDVKRRSNGNQGHEFGADLSDAQKDALIEYLKTL